MKLSIVVPCFNEGENLQLIFDNFSLALAGRDGIEVIFVNNNSSDDTSARLLKLIPEYPFSSSIFEIKPGYGSAIKSGLLAAKGEFVGWTHGDMQTSPLDVIKAFDIILEQADPKKAYVKGQRFGRSFFDTFFTIGMGLFESLYLKTWLFDINAQPNIFHKDFYLKLNNIPNDFALDLYALYLAKNNNLKIIRYPVKFPKRIHGLSSWNNGWGSKLKFIKRTIQFSVKLKKNLP